WREANDLANAGYPIAEIEDNGRFRISKPPGTGGAVNRETVTEQLLYEIGDPAAYITPDVVADFTSLQVTETARDVVQVESARGLPATDSYKVSIAYRDGFTASGTLLVLGPDAPGKARACGEMILQRLRRAGITLEHTNIECLGAGDCVPGVITAVEDPPEVVLRVAARDARRAAVERFAKEFAPLVTSGPPGVTGYTTGRPAVREVFAYWPALIAKHAVQPVVEGLDGWSS
ncbi:MAG TPA: acyclic terpene utilization AtuA family protein, partial [Gemmataceae bacterium]|nr:acyclic terpene utilization AtuA family protein [Gemmataceae bacterium]